MGTAIALATLVTAVVVAAAICLIALIEKGYGTMTWGFLLIFALPLLTYGVWLLRSAPEEVGVKGEQE